MQITWSSFQKLTEENIRKYVPRDAGIYLLWVKLKNDKWRCYYVGQADNLERRLLQHLSDAEENKCIKANVHDYISGYECAKVAEQSDRDGIEKYLYDHYKPDCNEIDPGGKPICIFWSNPASDSGSKWPLILIESGHRFWFKKATSGPVSESLGGEAALDNLEVIGHDVSSTKERRHRCHERGYPCEKSKMC